MNRQITKRLCAPLVHDVLGAFCSDTLGAAQAAEKLKVSRSRLYGLRTEYLKAKASGTLQVWMPGLSGGDRAEGFPPEVEGFLRAAIPGGYSYAFAASEAHRLFGADANRWGVRRWAIAEGLAQEKRPERTPAHTRRWQMSSVGEIWQLDASPHRWFAPHFPPQPLFDMVDDASRVQVGIRLCLNETLADYVAFMRRSFESRGLPLALYVDNAAFFRSPTDGSPTGLGRRLAFYGVSLLFASTPQAKGKVERIHQVWQDRLPPFFRHNGFTPDTALADVNAAVEALAAHRNAHETHREVGMAPQKAWDAALAEGRSKLRSVPEDGWWPYVWSLWRNAVVGERGRVFHKGLSFPTQARRGEKVVLCEHDGGHYSVIKALPENPATHPAVLFTSLPQRPS